jgi:hypothetical protein
MQRFVFLVLWSFTASVAAQQPAPAFEVASVRPNTSGSGNSTTRTLPNETFQVVNAHLKSMVGYGYDMRPIQILGGPDWVESDRFDVLAKTPEKEWDGGQMRWCAPCSPTVSSWWHTRKRESSLCIRWFSRAGMDGSDRNSNCPRAIARLGRGVHAG